MRLSLVAYAFPSNVCRTVPFFRVKMHALVDDPLTVILSLINSFYSCLPRADRVVDAADNCSAH
jgi:hypothetical protein